MSETNKNFDKYKQSFDKFITSADTAADYITDKEGYTLKEKKKGVNKDLGKDVKILGMRPLVFATVSLFVVFVSATTIILLSKNKGK